MKKIVTLLTVFCLLLLAGCGTDSSATKNKNNTVKLGLLPLTSSAPLFIALEKGYFAAEDLDVQPQFFDAAHPIAVATASSQVDVGATGITASLYNMAAKGEKVAIVADKGREQAGHSSSALVVTTANYEQGVHSLADLKGKRVGITQKGSTFHYMLGRMLEQQGLSLEDVQIIPLNKLGAVMAALESQQIDAAILNEPNVTKVQKAGFAKLIVQVGNLIPYQTSAIFYAPNFAKEGDRGLRFMRAYQKACNYYYDGALLDASPQQKEEIIRIIAKYVKAPQEDIALGLPYIDRDGQLLSSDIDTQISWYRDHQLLDGQITGQDMVDNSFLSKALAH